MGEAASDLRPEYQRIQHPELQSSDSKIGKLRKALSRVKLNLIEFEARSDSINPAARQANLRGARVVRNQVEMPWAPVSSESTNQESNSKSLKSKENMVEP
ncbi:hypothetical protein Nepgr_002837 [Nepenthes gracilis]|uniref:Uncharacterized protein n=1 Tax=Nepenthes gracilis TaxID=150966 RepID=A0AAD3P9B6_NEPGR|nr:hypothetical protein Nepgr_002837 [Nepenthes gracilis]